MLHNETDKKVAPFTDEQKAQLEEYDLKLSHLLSEIVNHTKILKGTKSECDRAVKERAYQEELLAKLLIEIPVKEKEKESIEASIREMEKYIGEEKKKSEELKKAQDEKTAELAKREADLVEKEKQTEALHKTVMEENEKQQKDRIKLDKAVSVLKETLKIIEL